MNAQTATAETTDSVTSMKRPTDTVRVGSVEIAIWKNPGQKGDFFSASAPTVRYQDAQGEWKNGNSFKDTDLACMAAAATEAGIRIRELTREQARSQGR